MVDGINRDGFEDNVFAAAGWQEARQSMPFNTARGELFISNEPAPNAEYTSPGL